jgi:hypothetical protein
MEDIQTLVDVVQWVSTASGATEIQIVVVIPNQKTTTTQMGVVQQTTFSTFC